MKKLGFMLLAMSLIMLSCSKDDNDSNDSNDSLVGTKWASTYEGMTFELEFMTEKDVIASITEGSAKYQYSTTYTYNSDKKKGVIFSPEEGASDAEFSIDGNKLTLYDEDEEDYIILTKQ